MTTTSLTAHDSVEYAMDCLTEATTNLPITNKAWDRAEDTTYASLSFHLGPIQYSEAFALQGRTDRPPITRVNIGLDPRIQVQMTYDRAREVALL